MDTSVFGKEAKKARKKKINDLISVVKGQRGWKESFIKMNPSLDTVEGGRLLEYAVLGRSDDAELLKCLEKFIPWVEETKPEWFTKKKSQESITV